MLCTELVLNIYLFCETLVSDVGSRNLKVMYRKDVRGLGDRLNVRNDVKVSVCNPGRKMVLWTKKGKLGRETDFRAG